MNIPQGWDSTDKLQVLRHTVHLVVGCPGSGKSWICNQLKDHFTLVHHDLFIGMSGPVYITAIAEASLTARKPLLAEAPFSISNTKDPLEALGFTVVPVVIDEEPKVIEDRYFHREQKQIPKGHLTRQLTYRDRAVALGWFHGDVYECLAHLLEVEALLKVPT